jgi:hypothetical protein
MKLIHALLARLKGLAVTLGLSKAAAVAEAADEVIVSVEQLVEAIGLLHAQPNDLVFLATPETNVELFKQMVGHLLTALAAQSVRNDGAKYPNIAILPPGVDIQVVRGAVEQAAVRAAVKAAVVAAGGVA